MRLVNGGVNCKNNHCNYAPTVTGCGHAFCLYGDNSSVPWYNRQRLVMINMADESVYLCR